MNDIKYRTPINSEEFKEYDLFRWRILRKPIGKDINSFKDDYEDKAFHLQLKAGQMALHDVFIVHGSGVNTSPYSRRGMTMRFMPTSSKFDRKLAHKHSEKYRLDHQHRTLFLMSGVDESGVNDFIVRN